MNLIPIGAIKLEKQEAEATARFERVIVVNPPSPPGYVANRESHGGYGQLYPLGATIPISLDIPYLAAYLTSKAIPLDLLEAQGLELDCDQLAAAVVRAAHVGEHKGRESKTLVVVRVALCCLDWDLSVCEAIGKAASGVKLAIYGSIVPGIQKRVERETFLDYIMQGEPDETVYELATGVAESDILGLDVRRDGGWQRNPSRPLIKDLDKLPFPKWELLPHHKYTLPRSSTTSAVPFLPMLTSRGCPFGCHYCPYPVSQGLPFRFRSPGNVVDEIEHLVRDLKIEYIIFRDPMFSLRQDRVVAICSEIQKRGLKLRWKCETRIDCLSEPTLRAMAAAGCVGINFGIESADVAIQANVGRKPIAQEKFMETVDLCRKIGIRTFCFFIIGLPGDTAFTILETIDFAIRLKPSWVQFNAASPLIGTKLRDWAVAKGLTSDDDFSYKTSHEAMMGNENLTKEQVASLHGFATVFERFLLNRGGILKDETRPGWLYGAARGAANRFAGLAARAVFQIGSGHFKRAHAPALPPGGAAASAAAD